MNTEIPDRIKKAIERYKNGQAELGFSNIEEPSTVVLENEKEFDIVKHMYNYIVVKNRDDITQKRFGLHNYYVKCGHIFKKHQNDEPIYAPEYFCVLEDIGLKNGWSSVISISEYIGTLLFNKIDIYDLRVYNELIELDPLNNQDKLMYKDKTVMFFQVYGYDRDDDKMVIKYRNESGDEVEKTVVPICRRYPD